MTSTASKGEPTSIVTFLAGIEACFYFFFQSTYNSLLNFVYKQTKDTHANILRCICGLFVNKA